MLTRIKSFFTGLFRDYDEPDGFAETYHATDSLACSRPFLHPERAVNAVGPAKDCASPDADGWIKNTSGELPVPPETIVEVRFGSGRVSKVIDTADIWVWTLPSKPQSPFNDSLIDAYRIVGEPAKDYAPEDAVKGEAYRSMLQAQSPRKYIFWDGERKKWRVIVQGSYIGRFARLEDAVKARNAYLRLWGIVLRRGE